MLYWKIRVGFKIDRKQVLNLCAVHKNHVKLYSPVSHQHDGAAGRATLLDHNPSTQSSVSHQSVIVSWFGLWSGIICNIRNRSSMQHRVFNLRIVQQNFNGMGTPAPIFGGEDCHLFMWHPVLIWMFDRDTTYNLLPITSRVAWKLNDVTGGRIILCFLFLMNLPRTIYKSLI